VINTKVTQVNETSQGNDSKLKTNYENSQGITTAFSTNYMPKIDRFFYIHTKFI